MNREGELQIEIRGMDEAIDQIGKTIQAIMEILNKDKNVVACGYAKDKKSKHCIFCGKKTRRRLVILKDEAMIKYVVCEDCIDEGARIV